MVVRVKTTVELDAALLRRAKERAAREGSSLRSLIEQSLQRLLDEDDLAAEYVLPDRSVGGDGPDPALSDGSGWLALAYEGRGT
jgi:hypothetical protein